MDNHFICYGFKTPSSNPATATQVTTTHDSLYEIHFKCPTENTQRVYICRSAAGAVKATGVDIITFLDPGESWDWVSYERQSRSKDPAGFWLFSDNGTDKVLVTGHQR